MPKGSNSSSVAGDFSPARLILKTPVLNADYAWQAIVSYSEGEHVLLLSFSALTFHVIPKRAFDSRGLEAFRALLAARTVDAGSAVRQGFDVIPRPALPVEVSEQRPG